MATALALPLALALRWPPKARRAGAMTAVPVHWLTGLQEMWHLRQGRRILLAGFVYAVMEGVLISTASLVLAGRLGADGVRAAFGVGVGTVAGLVLAVRWTSDILFGPAIGALADRLGHVRVAVALATVMLGGVVGVTQLAGAWLVLCLMLVFVSSAGLTVTLAAIASGVALAAGHPHHVVGAYTTAGDAGSALGPTLAYSAAALIGIAGLYVAAALALLAATLWLAADRRQMAPDG